MYPPEPSSLGRATRQDRRRRRVRALAALSGFTLLLSSAPQIVRAGAASIRPATCRLDSKGGGHCTGTFGSFRNSTDAKKLVVLQVYMSTSGTVSRYAIVDSAETGFLYLSLPPSSPLRELFDKLATAAEKASLFVQWDSSKRLTALQIYHESGLY